MHRVPVELAVPVPAVPGDRRRDRHVDDDRRAVEPGRRHSQLPLLEIPTNETVQFNLTSVDVIHSFWIVAVRVQAGRHPRPPEPLRGHRRPGPAPSSAAAPSCAALYHSRMLFKVKIVTPAQFQRSGSTRSRRRSRRAARECSVTTLEQPDRARPPTAPRSYRKGSILAGLAVLDRPQDHRAPVPDHLVRLLPDRRPDGADHAGRAARAGHAVRVRRAVQPAVHHARHDHAAAVRHPAVRRVRERDPAAADRRARRRVPAAEPAQLLAVPVRRADRAGRLPHPGRRGRLRLVRLLAADQRDPLARASAATCGSWAWRCPVSAPSSAASTSSPRSSACARRA